MLGVVASCEEREDEAVRVNVLCRPGQVFAIIASGGGHLQSDDMS